VTPTGHVDDFAKAFVARSRAGGPPRVATLLIICPRAEGEGYAYGTQALIAMPSAGMLMSYLTSYLPPGSTLSLHCEPARKGVPLNDALALAEAASARAKPHLRLL
jgi:hypothetical protein